MRWAPTRGGPATEAAGPLAASGGGRDLRLRGDLGARRGEEVDAADHRVAAALGAVLRGPLAVLEAAGHGDQPAAAQVLRAGLGGLAPDRHVDVAGVAAAAHAVHGQAQATHGVAVTGGA